MEAVFLLSHNNFGYNNKMKVESISNHCRE